MSSGKNTLDLTVYPNDEGEDISFKSDIKALLQVRNYGDRENFTLGGFSFDGLRYKGAVLDKAYQRDIENFKIVEAGGITVSEVTEEHDIHFEGTRAYSLTLEIPLTYRYGCFLKVMKYLILQKIQVRRLKF